MKFAITTGSHVATCPSSTQAPPGALNTAAVVGIVLSHVVVIAIAYTCAWVTNWTTSVEEEEPHTLTIG